MMIATLPRPVWLPSLLLAALCASPLANADDTPPKCTYVEVASLPIRYVGEGLVPAVDGTINARRPRC